MSEKKKTVVLGIVGAASALGLGWLLSKVIGGNGDEEKPEVKVTMYWD